MPSIHTRSTLERELERVRSDILRMGSLVERAIERSVQALKDARPRPGSTGHQRRRRDQPVAL